MKKGTILIVGNFELPDKGASANRVVSNKKLFKALGFRVALLGAAKADFEGIRSVEGMSDAFEEPYPKTSGDWLRHMVSVENIRTVAERYHDLRLIILYNSPYSLLLAGKRAFRGVRVAYDCTEWNPFADGNLIKREVKKLDEGLIRKRAGKTSDGMIVISRLMEREYANCAPLLLPPLVDVGDPIWLQERAGHDGFEFIFAGDINGTKERLDLIVEAFSGSELPPDAFLTVVGVEKEEFSVRYPAARLDPSRVRFLGRLSHFETIGRVLSADCYIFIREADRRNSAGFPTKFAEAFTAGLPIITTDVSDVSEYMTSERGIVLSSTAPEGIAAALKEIAARPRAERRLNETFCFEKYTDAAGKWLSELFGDEEAV